MLSVTANAAQAIGRLLADQPESGLRIAPDHSNGSGARLGLAIAENPSPGDQVIEEAGWKIFVDEEVAETLDGTLLDARVGEDSTLQFSVVRPA